MIRPQRPKGYRLVETRQGDTVQAIAARELNDAGRWGEIVSLNNLVSPYIVDSIADLENTPDGRVLLAGQQLKLPAPPRRANASIGDPFGTDMLLDKGRLVANEAGDWATISEYHNLTQAVRHRVETRLGELIWHPDYGCGVWRLLGRKDSEQNGLLAAALVERSLRADPRVVEAKNVTAEMKGDELRTKGEVIAVDGQSLPMAFGGEGE